MEESGLLHVLAPVMRYVRGWMGPEAGLEPIPQIKLAMLGPPATIKKEIIFNHLRILIRKSDGIAGVRSQF
jgi:hypothetical protein